MKSCSISTVCFFIQTKAVIKQGINTFQLMFLHFWDIGLLDMSYWYNVPLRMQYKLVHINLCLGETIDWDIIVSKWSINSMNKNDVSTTQWVLHCIIQWWCYLRKDMLDSAGYQIWTTTVQVSKLLFRILHQDKEQSPQREDPD